MDEVIGVTNGYGCRNQIKSRRLPKVATSRVLRLQGGGSKALRSFLVASFWRLASQVGGLVSNKLSSASVKSVSIKKRIGQNGGEGGPPYFNVKGGIAVSVSQPFL